MKTGVRLFLASDGTTIFGKIKEEILKEITGTYGNTGQAAAGTQSRLGNSKVKSGIQSVRGDDAGNRGAEDTRQRRGKRGRGIGTDGNGRGSRDSIRSGRISAIHAIGESNEAVRTRMTREEALSIVASMEEHAEVAPELVLTPENWVREFGEDGIVNTPIGEVKMGNHQYAKMMRQNRNGKLGMVKPTLENPDIIVEDISEAKDGDITERGSSYVFVKAFIKLDGSRYYYFTSVTIRKDGHEVVVSNQEKRRNVLANLLVNGKLAWKHADNVSVASDVANGLYSSQGNVSDPAIEGTDAPQTNYSESKDSKESHIYKKRIIKIAILSDIKAEREAIRAEQTAAQQEYDYWNNVKTLLNRQDVNTTEQITEEQPADANLSVAENETLQPRQTVEETTAAKQEEQQQYPTDEAGEPLWYEMTDEQFDVAMTELGDDADAFIADNIKEAQKTIKKAEKAKPKSAEFAKRKAEQQAITAEKAAAQKAYDYWTAQQARRSENAQSENIIENEIDKKEEILNLQQTYENNVRQTESTNRGKLQSETPQSDRSRKQRTSQISQSIPQREFRTQDEGNRRMAQAESAIRRGKSDRNNETQLSGSESAISGLEKEQREAEAYAKANGIWIPYTELSELGYPSLSGNENENYTGEDGYIYKVNNLQNSGGILSLFNRINLHNEIFPETSYTFIGRTQPIKRPNYWIAAQTADKNSITVLEVNKGKDNVEM